MVQAPFHAAVCAAALLPLLLATACTPPDGDESLSSVDQALAPLDDPDPSGGGPIDPDPPPDPEPPWNDGTPCNNPSIVYMSRGNGAGCTGILIGPQQVLTAAHCLHQGGQPVPVDEISYGIGGGACQQGDANAVAYEIHPDYDDTTHYSEVDLAVVRLTNPIPGATYAQFSITTPHVGDPVTMIGYGPSPAVPGLGTQRCMSATIAQIAPHLIVTNRLACGGDSGGPVLDASGRILGTLGGTDDADCIPGDTGRSYFGTDMGFVLDALQFLNGPGNTGCNSGETRTCRPAGGACFTADTAIGEETCHLGTSTCVDSQWGACEDFVGPTAELCNFRDDDCDGDVDEDCTPACGDDLCNGTETHETCPGDCDPPFTCVWPRVPMHVGGTGMVCVCSALACPGQSQNPQTCECTTPNTCGNGVCDYPGELGTCAIDCGSCGDGFCSIHEDAWSCAEDCGGSSCICGWDCPPNTEGCESTCGDGQCDLLTEDSWSCPDDCDLGGSCVCGYDCPPNTEGCGGFCGDGMCDLVSEDSTSCPSDCMGGGWGGGDWGNPGDYCGDSGYWGAWIDTFGWDDAVYAYETFCGYLAQ